MHVVLSFLTLLDYYKCQTHTNYYNNFWKRFAKHYLNISLNYLHSPSIECFLVTLCWKSREPRNHCGVCVKFCACHAKANSNYMLRFHTLWMSLVLSWLWTTSPLPKKKKKKTFHERLRSSCCPWNGIKASGLKKRNTVTLISPPARFISLLFLWISLGHWKSDANWIKFPKSFTWRR